jgi:cytochrome c
LPEIVVIIVSSTRKIDRREGPGLDRDQGIQGLHAIRKHPEDQLMLWRTAFAMPVVLVPALSVAQPIGDPAAGRRLAEAWCSECHAITRYSASEQRRGPDFFDVARRPSTTPLSLNVFLRSNHDNMPNFILQRSEADDIVAYILSLKGQ